MFVKLVKPLIRSGISIYLHCNTRVYCIRGFKRKIMRTSHVQPAIFHLRLSSLPFFDSAVAVSQASLVGEAALGSTLPGSTSRAKDIQMFPTYM